ncbi:tRNA (N(6)-L-threonylcarbamoyladenosine(37)-C(2))-methylthiotransferase MtaB [Thermodesulfovibrio sp.]|uniref:tRNA (N(6)-L-threonylcarbamoyladenosine(37)-C(2))- methylthiotransferase MtaB n=1 Tax=Thermodesulfovibrio sp. TaxID=2067987 RepID=UPI00309C9F36
MKVALIVFGCRVNQAEFQKLEKSLKIKGYEITDDLKKADCWIINTCAVTNKAEIQSRQIINRALKEGKKCFATGCYINLRFPKETENLKIISNQNKDSIINYFNTITSSIDSKKINRHRAVVKIQDGCNNYCSYCVVPYLRGKPISYKVSEIIEEIKDYESSGIKEIILSGINIGLFGFNEKEKTNLNFLLKNILKKTSIPKIRLSSIEINHVDEELLEIMGDSRVCKHLHIPLQHGSDRILKLMNRKYDIAQYLKIIEKILLMYPNIAIGTDLIVGFPSETEDDFKATLKIAETVNFSYLHVFNYSKRPFTVAAKMPNHLPEQLKKERTSVLVDIAKAKKRKYIEKFINSQLEIIVENRKNHLFTGTSDNYIKCMIENKDGISSGELVIGKVKSIDNDMAFVSSVIKR